MIKYLTFFDRNYAARGVLMIESLRAVAPQADIIVFALDHETEHLLGQIFDDKITVLPPDYVCLLYTSPSPRDQRGSRMPSSA